MSAAQSFCCGQKSTLSLIWQTLPRRHHAWLLATSLKYRAAVQVYHGRLDEAETEFAEAYAILSDASEVLIRFIGATIAAEAGESLLTARQASEQDYLACARATFRQLEHFQFGPLRGGLWLERVDGLLQGHLSQTLPNPQNPFIY